MRKPILIISNDYHIKENNVEKIKDLVQQKCDLAKSLNLKNVAILGDLFESRKSQKLETLKGVEEIFNIFKNNDIICHIIPGNHCKTIYSSNHSFLDAFKYHPSICVYDEVKEVEIKGENFTFVPFWEESILIEKLKEVKDDSIVLSHFGTNSSTNNDGKKNSSPITVASLKRFKKVFLGHFHNEEKISSNCYHRPSLYQANFDEDDNKGFTVLYDDLTYEIIKSKFKKYIKVKIDLDSIDNKELARLTKDNSDSEDNIRFEFIGSEAKLRSLKKELFTANGIEVATKVKEIEDSIEFIEGGEVISFTNDNIMEEFTAFCEKEELKEEDGKSYLTKKLNING
jgi:exonuclease SbcD